MTLSFGERDNGPTGFDHDFPASFDPSLYYGNEVSENNRPHGYQTTGMADGFLHRTFVRSKIGTAYLIEKRSLMMKYGFNKFK